MMLLMLMLACGAPTPPAPPADGPSPSEAVQAVRLELHEAHQAWSEGRRSEAQARVHAAYAQWFEPLEPALRAREPDRTLALEYAYGRLGARMGRSGDALAIAQQVQGITREMDDLVAILPATAAVPGPVVNAPKSEDVSLPSHLVSEGE